MVILSKGDILAKHNTKTKEERLSEKLDYAKILFLQINRINNAPDLIDRRVALMNLEGMLYHYIEDRPAGKEYKKEIIQIQKDINKTYEETFKGRADQNEEIKAKWLDLLETDLKYKAIMKFIGKLGLLPLRDVSYDESEED